MKVQKNLSPLHDLENQNQIPFYINVLFPVVNMLKIRFNVGITVDLLPQGHVQLHPLCDVS